MEITSFSSTQETDGDSTRISLSIALSSADVSDFSLTFIADVTQHLSGATKEFPVAADFSARSSESGTALTVDIPSFRFSDSLSLDELTNVSCLRLSLTCSGSPASLMIPVFCRALSDSPRVSFEVLSPICNHSQ